MVRTPRGRSGSRAEKKSRLTTSPALGKDAEGGKLRGEGKYFSFSDSGGDPKQRRSQRRRRLLRHCFGWRRGQTPPALHQVVGERHLTQAVRQLYRQPFDVGAYLTSRRKTDAPGARGYGYY